MAITAFLLDLPQFTVPADGPYLIAVGCRESGYLSGPRTTYRLRVSTAKPDFRVIVMPYSRYYQTGSAARQDGTEAYDVFVHRVDGFAGPVFHTSRYDHDVELAGKRVAIVGTGSTACQLGPALAPTVGQLDVYQREPGWVMPKNARDLTDEERARLRGCQCLTRFIRVRSTARSGRRDRGPAAAWA